MTGPLIVESEGSGHAILCMHGLGGGAHWFKGLALRLRARYRILSLDLPGTGANRAGHAPYSIEHVVETLSGYLAGEPGPVSLLGHSMGTILALKINAALPGRISSLISVGGLPAVTNAMRKRLSDRRDEILRTGSMAGIGWRAAEGVFAKATLKRDPEILALYARQFESHDPHIYVECLEALLASSAEDVLGMARLPCLVLGGSEDAYAPPAEVTRFAGALPGPMRRIELNDCGHMPFLEYPALFSNWIAEFLKSQDAHP